MSYFDVYKKRLQSYGNSSVEVYYNATKQIINKTFADSPGYKIVKVNDIDTETVISQGRVSEEKTLLFKPEIVFDKGSIVDIDGLIYLILDFQSNELYPIASIRLCNSTLILSGETTKAKIGEDDFGRPIYEETEGDPVIIPCIVETIINTLLDTKEPIKLPEGRLNVMIPFTEHHDINLGKSFSMYDEQYKIIGIDRTMSLNNTGIITINGERVVT